jgi:hypothetical protein
MHSLGKRAYGKTYREFESPPLRFQDERTASAAAPASAIVARMRTTRATFFAAAALAALGLAGCTGAGADSERCRFDAMPAVIGPSASLAFPAPGASGVQTSNLQIEILNGFSDENLLLDGGQSSVILTANLERPAAPPLATPPPGNAWFVTVPQLAAHTTYAVSLHFPPLPPRLDGCIPPPQPSLFPLGSFTTQ